MNYNITKKGVCTDGFKAYGLKEGKYGVTVILSDRVCDCVGVFTKNSVKAASVIHNKKIIKNGVQLIVANSGNANACISSAKHDNQSIASYSAKALDVDLNNTSVSSTGIIGKKLEVDKVKKLVDKVIPHLSCSDKASMDAAKAIMTTDTKPKYYSVEKDGLQVGGICKGSGMIAPDMATILSFVTTNAHLPRKVLEDCLIHAVDKSFNMLSIEGDMSTNDTALLLTNRKVKCSRKAFSQMLDKVFMEFAKQIALDGEGATKYLEVTVNGCKTDKDAVKSVKAVVNSILVKTAFYGENPNWGRIIAAIGSVVSVDYTLASITFESEKGKILMFDKGVPGDMKMAGKILKAREIFVTVDLGLGTASATGYGCDITPENMKINAGYN